MAGEVYQLLCFAKDRAMTYHTSCSDLNDCIVWMLDLWCGHFSNADFKGFLVMHRFHGGCDSRLVACGLNDGSIAIDTGLSNLLRERSILSSMDVF